MKGSGIIACTVALLLSASSAWAFKDPEPTGFDKVKFGTSVEDVKKAYPAMKKPEGKKAAGLNHPKIERYFLEKHQLPGLEKPTDIDLQFWSGKFWLGQIHFGDNDPAKVDAYLLKTYGEPGYKDENFRTWNGKTAGAVQSIRNKTFEVHDEGMSNEARRELFQGKKLSSSMQVQATPAPAAATPAGAPAAPAPSK